MRRLATCTGLLALAALHAPSAHALSFSTAPALPALPAVTLNGQSQTVTAQMNNFGVTAGALDLAGWNVTVNGDASSGHSAVFKVYCPNATCGSDSGPGYVTGGATLAPSSMTLNSSGASWTGVGLVAPVFLCNLGCAVDSATPVKVATVATLSVASTWTTTGWSASSVSVSVPTTVRVPAKPGEVYRADVLWTLNAGP